MAATNSTTNYGLPQWVATDKPQMADFNTAMADIDTSINLVQAGGNTDGRFTAMPYIGTAPIVETGFDAVTNAVWTKWADGTMVCSNSVSVPSGTTTAVYSYPQTFTQITGGGYYFAWSANSTRQALMRDAIVADSITGWTVAFSSSSTIDISIRLFSIGKWK